MDLTTIDPIWWVALGVVVVILIGLLVWSGRRKAHRTQRLKGQFKSEYDRAASSGSRKKAEEDLERRLVTRGDVDLADLDEADVEGLEHDLGELVRSFVDGPQQAALGMTQLVGRIAAARGYVAAEARVLDLVSVDHPEQVASMRRSEADLEKAKGDELTEASRRLVVDARVLAQRLLAEGRTGAVPEAEGERSLVEPGTQEAEAPTEMPPPSAEIPPEPSEAQEHPDDPPPVSSAAPPASGLHRDAHSASSWTPPPPARLPQDDRREVGSPSTPPSVTEGPR